MCEKHCKCFVVAEEWSRREEETLKPICIVLRAAIPQVQSHTVVSCGYIGIDTLCLPFLAFSLPPCNTLTVCFYQISFLHLFISLWYKRHLLITKYAGRCSPHLRQFPLGMACMLTMCKKKGAEAAAYCD